MGWVCVRVVLPREKGGSAVPNGFLRAPIFTGPPVCRLATPEPHHDSGAGPRLRPGERGTRGGAGNAFPASLAGGVAQAALLCLALLPAAADLLTLPAQAQDIELGEVTVAADRPLLMTAYTSVTVVEVRDRDPGETLADVLDEVPGVQVLRSGGEGQRQSVSIRGADSKQVAVLIEGFSLADPQGGSVDLSQIPLAAVDRIEVYRGPRGALAGASSLGGVVVIRLKTGAEAAEKVSTVGGSFGTWKGGMSAAAGGTLVTYSHEQSEGDFPYVDTNGHDRTRENNRSVTDRVLLNADLALSSRSHLELLGSAALTDRGGPGLEQFPTLEARETAHNWLAGTRFRLDRFPCRDCDLQASASYSAWQWTFADPAPYMPPPVDTQSLSQRVGLAAGTVLRASAWLSFAVQAEAAEEWMDIRRFQAGQAEHDRWSADGTLAATLTPGHLPFAADVRVRIASSGPFGAEVVPGLDVRWNAADHLAVSVSANRAYRIPTFDELYFEGSGIRGNEDLSPGALRGEILVAADSTP